MSEIIVRRAKSADYKKVLTVERLSTPGLQYLPQVFDMFLADPRGEFSVAELDGEIVACAKFSVLPDGTAWLETIRVAPAQQGLGIGKRFYENYFAIAAREGVSTMRMYTGIGNAASKGLAERFGFTLEQTFNGATQLAVAGEPAAALPFEPVTDATRASELLMPHAERWAHFLVMNRTFYKLTPSLCGYLANSGAVFVHGDSVIALGARFMPEAALHVGLFAGDAVDCLAFAAQLAHERGVPQVSCLFPKSAESTRNKLISSHFQLAPWELIVMAQQSSTSAA